MKALKIFALLTLALSAVLPNVPDPNSPVAVAFVVACGGLLCTWALRVTFRRFVVIAVPGAGWLTAFLMTVLVSGLVAPLWGTPVALWFRGAVPFLFLFTFFPFAEIARRDPQFVVNAVHAAAIVWLCKVIITAGAAVPAVLSGEAQRLTHVADDWGSLILPFSFIGLALSLFSPAPLAEQFRWLLAPAFTAVSVLTVYRSQIVIALFLWLTFLVELPLRMRRTIVVAGTGFVLALLPWLIESDLLVNIASRFAGIQSEAHGSRAAEIQYALAQFVASPLLGKGLGFQVPVAEVTHAGDWGALAQVGADSVGYVHNIVAYLLMDLGLVGLTTFFGFVVFGTWCSRCASNRKTAAMARAGRIAMWCLLFFCLFQATVRLIQTNLIIAALVSALAAVPARRSHPKQHET